MENMHAIYFDQHNQNKILTSRQTDVIKLRASGLLNKQIANVLEISEYTVKEHITAALRKLQVRKVEQAIVILVKKHIIE